ncbi:MAG: radical SAM protein [Nanoarchaeota archaeon]|nr:radical SAM protein [Nanoarchaeota archaeon]
MWLLLQSRSCSKFKKIPSHSEADILKFLKKRKHLLEGVCITGGEPTNHKQLPNLLKKIKNLGYNIKLDTNGTNPDIVCSLIKEELVDYIAMDVKASEENYSKVAWVKSPALQSDF